MCCVFINLFQLALYVLSFLEPRDLIRASQTCRYWRTLAEDNLLWREKCQEEGLSEAFVFGNRLNRRQQNRRCGGVTDRNGVTQWKSVYKRQRQIENNWSHGSLRPPKVTTVVTDSQVFEMTNSVDHWYSSKVYFIAMFTQVLGGEWCVRSRM